MRDNAQNNYGEYVKIIFEQLPGILKEFYK